MKIKGLMKIIGLIVLIGVIGFAMACNEGGGGGGGGGGGPSGPPPRPGAVRSVSLDHTTFVLFRSYPDYPSDRTISAIISPVDAINKNVTWSSSAPLKVRVTGDGLTAKIDVLSGAVVGDKITITVRTEDNNRTATCVVEIKESLVEMVYINPTGPEGFLMGSPAGEIGRNPSTGDTRDERLHTVHMKEGFYMGVIPIARWQWMEVMQYDPSSFRWFRDLPVNRVSFYSAIVFCNRQSKIEGKTPAYEIRAAIAGEEGTPYAGIGIGDWTTNPDLWGQIPANIPGTDNSQITNVNNDIGREVFVAAGSDDSRWTAVRLVAGSTGYRLPTEAQWEYAAREEGKSLTAFFNGNNYNTEGTAYDLAEVGKIAWYLHNNPCPDTGEDSTTKRVGQKTANSLGLLDMHGNIWEWCWDGPRSYPAVNGTEGDDDPVGPLTGARSQRGGSHSAGVEWNRSATRWSYGGLRDWFGNVGIRVVLPCDK